MDLHEALYTTRAMRRLKPDPVPMDVQARILDAAIRAPNIGQQWRFILVDDRQVIARLAPLYEQAFERLLSGYGMSIDALLNAEGDMGRVARSGVHLARNFGDVPLVLFAFGKAGESSGVLPAVWSAMLAARAEGIGSTWTGVLQSFFPDELNETLGVPADEEWRCFGVVPMGYPTGRWGIAPRAPVHTVAFRNRWGGDLGFTVDEPMWKPAAAAGS
jgi:nitroreductase